MDSEDVVRALIRERAELLGYAWAIVRDHHLADDVFQEVAVLAMRRAAEIRDVGHLMRWSRKAARFKALEALRDPARRRAVPLDEDVLGMLEADWPDADSRHAGDEVDHLRTCLGWLAKRARQVVHLRYVEGKSGGEVAALLNVEVRSVYVMLSRVHGALRECMERRRRRLATDAAAGGTHGGDTGR